MDKKVPHNFKYHAEIIYEGEVAMRFTCACGNTIDELLWDIDYEFDQIGNKEPKIKQVLKNPNTNQQDITEQIIKEYHSRGSK